MKRFKKLARKVEQWAEEKGILEKGTPIAQADKTIEEANEIKIAILNNDKAEIIDGIGDTLVTLIIQAKMQGVDILDCLENAYNVISKRKGKMINGTFVKDTPIPVILYENDYVIIEENGDFARSSSGQIVIYGNWLDGARDLRYGEELKSCSILTNQQKGILKENIRIFQQ